MNKVQLQDLKAKSKELRSNFKNLCKGREKNIKDFKYMILISPEDFKQYGASYHIKNINELFVTIEKEGSSSKNITTTSNKNAQALNAYNSLQ